MAKKIDDDDDFETDDDGEMLDDLDEIESKQSRLKVFSDARRRLEQLHEEKELARLINSSFDYMD